MVLCFACTCIQNSFQNSSGGLSKLDLKKKLNSIYKVKMSMNFTDTDHFNLILHAVYVVHNLYLIGYICFICVCYFNVKDCFCFGLLISIFEIIQESQRYCKLMYFFVCFGGMVKVWLQYTQQNLHYLNVVLKGDLDLTITWAT